MVKLKNLITFLYNHHLIRYLFVGGTTFFIDFGLLVLLHGKLNIGLAIAASTSYWVSILYNFNLNRNWTFSAAESKKLHQHILPYSILLCFNYLFTVLFLSLITRVIHYQVAKVIAVVVQVAWTYPIYKYVIFGTSSDKTNPA